MSFHFDVLQEPWLPAVTASGELTHLGILETLEKAHMLQGLSDGSPLVEYGLYRFLCVFLMDALRPQTQEDIEDILDAGCFDPGKIEAYAAQCQQEGVSFDLFHEKRPFLQTPYSESWDAGRESTAARLDVRIPTGNNHVHFNHLEREICFSYGEAARLLPAAQLFVTAGAQGYPSGVNGAPPYFAVIRGKNLFETLVSLLQPVEEIGEFEDPPVFWRCRDAVEPKKKVARTSWLYGMLFPARRICLIPEEAGVRKMYYSQGMNFCEPENWTDPHVTYRFGKQGRFPWRPNGQRAVWRNLNDLADPGHAPQILLLYRRLHMPDVSVAQLCLYGVQTSNASYLDLFRHDLRLPLVLLQPGRAELLGDCIAGAEEMAQRLRNALTSGGITQAAVQETAQSFYAGCEQALWELCSLRLWQEPAAGEQLLRIWVDRLITLGRAAVSRLTEKVSLSGRQWLELYHRLESWEQYLRKLKGAVKDG